MLPHLILCLHPLSLPNHPFDDDKVIVGSPNVNGASLKTTVVDQIKGEKILVFKYKPKNNYRRHTGHRQKYTQLLVESISME